jgi:hypothetical protein
MKKPSIGRTSIVPTSNAETVREFYRRQGEERERARLIDLLKEQNVIRHCGATGKLVFVNCNTLDVLYLKDDLANETASV